MPLTMEGVLIYSPSQQVRVAWRLREAGYLPAAPDAQPSFDDMGPTCFRQSSPREALESTSETPHYQHQRTFLLSYFCEAKAYPSLDFRGESVIILHIKDCLDKDTL